MTAISFDDIDAINAHASEEYGEWGTEIEVTQEMINDFAELTGDRQARKFAEALLSVVLGGWVTVDDDITAASKRWRLERMDRVDRNALRIGAAELRHRPQTPTGVILSEVVRLASTYGNERSAGFVNGLTASLAAALRPEDPR